LATSSTSEALVDATEATEFGAAIRDMRLAHNTELATVASTLRIRLVYLQAIEDGRFNDLPGPTYAAGFVRAYAEFLGLDLPEVMRLYREVALGSDRQAPLVAPSPVVEGTLPTGFILLIAAILAATAYGSWYYLTLNGRDAGDIVAKIPQQIAEIIGLESSSTETTTQQPDASVTTDTTYVSAQITTEQPTERAMASAVQPEQLPQLQMTTGVAPIEEQSEMAAPADTPIQLNTVQQAVSAEPSAAPATNLVESASSVTGLTSEAAVALVQEATTVPSELPAAGEGPTARFVDTIPTAAPPILPLLPSITGVDVPEASQTAALPGDAANPETTSRVILRATAISWVELRDANGKRVFSRLLKKGETYNVPGRGGITLVTGNAGGLDVLVDGQTIGPLGPVGAIRRNVLLEPAALLERSNARR